MQFVGKEHCYDWLKNYVKRYRDVLKATGKKGIENQDFFADLDALYQDFRIISGTE